MEKQSREVPIIEVFWKILMRWRSILVCALVGAGLLGTGVYFRAMKANHTQSEQETGNKEIVFTEAENEQIRYAVSLRESTDNLQEYMLDSILMNMNAQNEQVLVMQFYVDNEYHFNYMEENIPDNTVDIIKAYKGCVLNEELINRISENVLPDTEKSYIAELITSTEDVAGTKSNAIFEVRFIHYDRDILEEVSDLIPAFLNDNTQHISKTIGAHSLKLLSSDIRTVTDDDLAKLQSSYRSMLQTYDAQWKNLQASMTEAQVRQVDKELYGISDEIPDQASAGVEQVSVQKPKISLKYILLGAIIGVIVAIGWHICMVLLAGRLQFTEEIKSLYEIPVLGVVGEKKKQMVIDRLLLRLRARFKRNLSDAEKFEILLGNIEIICKQRNIKELYITGTEYNQLNEEMLNRTKEGIRKLGITLYEGNNVCYDMKSQKKMLDIKYVVVIEILELSRYREMEQEKNLILDKEIDLLGCIVVE